MKLPRAMQRQLQHMGGQIQQVKKNMLAGVTKPMYARIAELQALNTAHASGEIAGIQFCITSIETHFGLATGEVLHE